MSSVYEAGRTDFSESDVSCSKKEEIPLLIHNHEKPCNTVNPHSRRIGKVNEKQ